MREWLLFLLLLGIDALVLLLESGGISISYREAQILYGTPSLLQWIVQTSLNLWGENDLALRAPMILTHLLSTFLFYLLTRRYLFRTSDRLWLVAIFMLLPGINSAALLLDGSALVIVLLLLYVNLYDRAPRLSAALLTAMLFVDVSFALLFLGLFFYAVARRFHTLMVLTLLLFGASLYLHGFDTHGSPKGHFLDVLGLYAAVFSPIVFVYLVYVLFRKFVARDLDLLWFLSAVPLSLSLLLSFRQELEIQQFAPYLLLGMPLAAQAFFHSYRVRLRRFRRKYRILFTLSFLLLLLNAGAVFFHKEFYRFLEPGQKHFAYKQHVAKELASALKAKGIGCIACDDTRMQLRLRFYGIGRCETYRLGSAPEQDSKNVTISYYKMPVYQAYVTKINKKSED